MAFQFNSEMRGRQQTALRVFRAYDSRVLRWGDLHQQRAQAPFKTQQIYCRSGFQTRQKSLGWSEPDEEHTDRFQSAANELTRRFPNPTKELSGDTSHRDTQFYPPSLKPKQTWPQREAGSLHEQAGG